MRPLVHSVFVHAGGISEGWHQSFDAVFDRRLQHTAVEEALQVTVVREPVPELLDAEVIFISRQSGSGSSSISQAVRRQAVNQPFVVF